MRNFKAVIHSMFFLVVALLTIFSVPFDSQAVDKNGDLIKAARIGDIPAIKNLLEAGADVNAKDERDRTALNLALSLENPEAAKLLINKGADVTIKDSFGGLTPLEEASAQGYTEVAELILQKLKDKTDKNPALLNAVINSRLDTAKMLLNNKADPNFKDSSGNSALNLAKPSNIEMLGLLLDAGANINALDQNKQTVLMSASYKGDVNLVKYFLSKKADVNIKGLRDMTALDFAKQMDNTEVIKLLQSAGAK